MGAAAPYFPTKYGSRYGLKLDLGNNHIGDKGALTLASAISGGAIYQCKSVNLKGNPMSPAGKKAVAKAAKGNKGPPK